MKIEPVAYSREHDANSPSYYDVVSPNSQDAEMWAYALVPLYDQQAIDSLRAEVERLRHALLDARSVADEARSVYAGHHSSGTFRRMVQTFDAAIDTGKQDAE